MAHQLFQTLALVLPFFDWSMLPQVPDPGEIL